jgi:ABC-2 type transport system permease protein
MKAILILIAHSFKRVRIMVAVMGLVLALFQVFLIIIARSIQESNAFDQISALIPPFVRQMMGPAFQGFMSFRGMVSLGYFHLAIIGSLTGLAISVATMQASEIETGFMDLILSRPVARRWVITRSIILLVVCLILVLAMMLLGTFVGLAALAPKEVPLPQQELVLSLAGNVGLLALSWGAIGMAISATARRRAVAVSITFILALVTFLLDYVARAWEPAFLAQRHLREAMDDER